MTRGKNSIGLGLANNGCVFTVRISNRKLRVLRNRHAGHADITQDHVAREFPCLSSKVQAHSCLTADMPVHFGLQKIRYVGCGRGQLTKIITPPLLVTSAELNRDALRYLCIQPSS